MTATAPITYRGGQLCGTTGHRVQVVKGIPPVVTQGRYGHAVDCRCLDGAHVYAWRPDVLGRPRPERSGCCDAAKAGKPGRGCPMWKPRTP